MQLAYWIASISTNLISLLGIFFYFGKLIQRVTNLEFTITAHLADSMKLASLDERVKAVDDKVAIIQSGITGLRGEMLDTLRLGMKRRAN